MPVFYGDKYIKEIKHGSTNIDVIKIGDTPVHQSDPWCLEMHDDNRDSDNKMSGIGIELPSSVADALSGGTATLEMMVKLRSMPSEWWLGGGWHIQDGGMTHYPWETDGKVYMQTFLNSDNRMDSIDVDSNILTSWHLMQVKQGSSTYVLVCADDRQDTQSALSSLHIDKNNMLIGNSPDSETILNGAVYNIAIWNKYMSDRGGLKRLTGNESDLVAYYPCYEGSGTTLKDWTGNGHDATIRSDTRWKRASEI